MTGREVLLAFLGGLVVGAATGGAGGWFAGKRAGRASCTRLRMPMRKGAPAQQPAAPPPRPPQQQRRQVNADVTFTGGTK